MAKKAKEKLNRKQNLIQRNNILRSLITKKKKMKC